MPPTPFEIGSSVLTSSLRLWNGTWGKLPSHTPAQELELFDREDDAQCRQVREVLTELNLDAVIYPCPKGGQRHQRKRLQLQARALHSQPELPLLHDPNTGKVMAGAKPIIEYLFAQYLGQAPHIRLQPGRINRMNAQFAGMARGLGRGLGPIQAEPASQPRKMLSLYSFESSPYARLVRERLCALELPYHLINVGKQQWGEMGPAKRRLAPGPYQPLPGSKREQFLQQYGKVQIPMLHDPNSGASIFESDDIIHYLEQTYAKNVVRAKSKA
ncbi:glutathione S-transferase N-terminal domain-containing protein [Massilia sp. W12]|uniref:glutathione S-transferase N-terminal domain-containing protein n=1 Tax=Massilia sp. W12 TaxID=3126507 RepID=UPI0030D50787